MTPEIRLEHTAGLGKEAQVWLGDDLLTVCDGVSGSGRPCRPGLLTGVGFSYLVAEAFSWDQAIRANPARRVGLEPLRRWSYVAFGRIVSVAPVIVDYGLVRIEDGNWSTDELLVGRFVKIAVDRLDLVPQYRPDWPKGIG